MSEQDAKLNEAVRDIFQSWAVLEIGLSMYMGRLLMTDQFRGRIVWDGLRNFSPRLDLIRKLVTTYVDGSECEEVLAKLKTCRTLSKTRNKLAHQIFYIPEDSPHHVVFHKTERFTDAQGMEFLDDEKIQLQSLVNYPDQIKELGAFFGTRGNPGHVTSDLTLSIHVKTKWHRNLTSATEI
ncbi:MAG: hypothetical protein KC448_14775 [Yoonia sp.]|nr:hypothetical protein [Yoonia sp.]